MLKLKIKDDFIKLGQAMKLAGLADSGVEAKLMIQDGQVSVNGEVEYQRGKNFRMEIYLNMMGHRFRSWLGKYKESGADYDYKITGTSGLS